MKKMYMVLLLLVLAVVMAVGVWSVADRDLTVSAAENRELAELPTFTLGSLFDGSFTKAMENYYADTFPGREVLLEANRQINQFYYFSGSGEDSLLILDHNGGAEQGGEALREPQPEDVVEETEPPVIRSCLVPILIWTF